MTTPGHERDASQGDSELLAIEAGIDAIARDSRSTPDRGFEERLVAAAMSARTHRPPLRITHSGRDRRVPVVRLWRWGLTAAAMLAIATAVVAIRWQPTGNLQDGTVLASTHTELDEIADVWELLDDEGIASRVASLHGQASTISESINDEWIASSWLGEDSM